MYDATGVALGQNFAVTSGSYVGPYTEEHSPWGKHTGTYDIDIRRFGADGAPLGGPVLVNTSTADQQNRPSVAVLSNGGFVVAWESSVEQDGTNSFGIFGQRYGANGNAVGGEFRVTAASGDPLAPKTIAMPGGGFLVTWTVAGRDGDGNGIFAQPYDAAGHAVGTEFHVNQSTAGDQQLLDGTGALPVAVLTSGQVIQVWDGAPSNDSGEIYARPLHIPGVGFEDHLVRLPISAALVDTDGSESLVLKLSGFPAGATFSAGSLVGSEWVISDPVQIAALSAHPLVNRKRCSQATALRAGVLG